MTKNTRMKKRVCFGLDFTQYLQELQKRNPCRVYTEGVSLDFCKELDSKIDIKKLMFKD